MGKAIPYGVYDLASNECWVRVGINHNICAVVNTVPFMGLGNRMSRSVWSASSLLAFSERLPLTKAPASWTHSIRFAPRYVRTAQSNVTGLLTRSTYRACRTRMVYFFARVFMETKRHVFRGILRQDDHHEGRLVAGREAVLVLEDAVGLHLDAAVLPVAQVGDDLQPAIRQGLLLDARCR